MAYGSLAAGYRCAVRAGLALVVLSAVVPAQAYLGSFSPADGYDIYSGTIWGDVSLYNAGQYGANAGGGAYTQLNADTGLWKLQGPIGGYFDNSVDRNNAVSAGPIYPTNPPNTKPAYIVGNHFPGHLNDGSNLALRNDTPIGTGPMVYDYTLDSYDFGGVAPSTVTSGPVLTSFYFCPNPPDAPTGGKAGDKFTMSLVDSLGNIGLEWGYARDNEVLWRDGPSSLWTTTGIYANAADWDQVQLLVDLTGDTFGIDYYSTSSNTWTNLAPAGTPMGQAMTDLTHIGWQLEDGVSTGQYSGKNFFDDFSFGVNVPEPSAAILAGIALVGLFAWRRASPL